MAAFPEEDLAENLKTLDINLMQQPVQSKLGLKWDIDTDCFLFQLHDTEKLTTRRNVLLFLNSIYDRLGLLAPALIKEKFIMRKIVCDSTGWDDILT
jgi:hypothetical protein